MAESQVRENDEQKGKRHSPEHDPQLSRDAQGQAFGEALYTPTSFLLSRVGLTQSGAASRRADVIQRAQKTHGNRAVQRFLSAYEPEEEDDEIARRIESAAGGGSSLDAGVRGKLEGGLGANLEGVRVHTGAEADQLARSVQSVAFTSGQDIFFREGAYNPHTQEGQKLIAHEATHTIQQSRGPVEGTPSAGGVSISDPSDQYEQAAEHAAELVTRDEPMPRPRLEEELGYVPMQRSVQRVFMSSTIRDAQPPSMGQPQPGPLDEVGAGISQLGGAIGGAYGDVGGAIGSTLRSTTGIVGGAIGDAAAFTGGLGARVGGMAGDALSAFGSFAGRTGARIGSMVGGGVSRVEDMLGLGTGIGAGITQGTGFMGEVAGGMGQFADDIVTRGSSSVGSFYSGLGSQIGGAVSGIGDFMGGNVSRNMRAMGNAGASVASGIGGFVGGLDDMQLPSLPQGLTDLF